PPYGQNILHQDISTAQEATHYLMDSKEENRELKPVLKSLIIKAMLHYESAQGCRGARCQPIDDCPPAASILERSLCLT
ncbi:MAG: hypothetical protein LOD92_09335, partial [Bacillales bacterium]